MADGLMALQPATGNGEGGGTENAPTRPAGESISFVAIAKDEEQALPRLLASIDDGAFDQAVLLDTGSTDATVAIFRDWAERQALPLGYRVGSFEWGDNYAAARNAASALVTADWLCWADCDDEIVGARTLRGMISQLAPGVDGVKLPYVVEVPGSLAGPMQWRIRLLRRGAMRWRKPIHEELVFVDPRSKGVNMLAGAFWVHEKRTLEQWLDSNANYLRAARQWWRREPDNPEAKETLLREQRNRCTFRFLQKHGVMPWETEAAAPRAGEPVMYFRQGRIETVYPDGRVRVEQCVAQSAASDPGRNEPCVCGSGRKFKKCCGG